MKPTAPARFTPNTHPAATKRSCTKSTSKLSAPSNFTTRYADLIGAANDLAAQHDHYIHGPPQRK